MELMMSRGLSWRQHWLLKSIARREERNKGEPVAWCDIDYGPTSSDSDPDFFSRRVQWNTEQSLRRSLRSMERRGLVELDRYCFAPEPTWNGMTTQIVWNCIHLDDYVPGEMRLMTGALLTDAGRAVIAEDEAERRSDDDGAG
jgi:hypothetical protein